MAIIPEVNIKEFIRLVQENWRVFIVLLLLFILLISWRGCGR